MKEIRCCACSKMLARASKFDTIEIKCPRCGRFNITQRAASSRPKGTPSWLNP